ncbi:MAG: O-antigen ligase family protein [Hyphomicrobiales bacterium]
MTVAAGLRGSLEGRELSDSLASRLGAGAALLVAVLPVAMALANRSAPLLLAFAALLALASVAARTGWAGVGGAFAPLARSSLALGAAAFIGLAIASYGWSADRAQTLRALGEGAVPLLAGAVVLRLLPGLAPRWAARALAAGVIAAALICIGELEFDMPLRSALHLRAKAFEYNRPVLTLLVLFWPLCAVAMASRRSPVIWLALAATTAAIWCSQSGTAMFAQALSLIAALVAWRFPRAMLAGGAMAVAIVFAFIFAFGEIARSVLPDATYDALAWAHAADRVEIWRSYGAVMLAHPWLGVGFGTSATLGDTAIAGEVASEFRRMLAVGHPHNGYLQIGVELGMVGCLLALAIALRLLWNWRNLCGPHIWSRVGLFAMAAATMLVGHGAWQAWWIAVVFAGAAVTRTIVGHDVETKG